MLMLQLGLFYILLLALQGVMSALFSNTPSPDLFLIAAVSVLWHLRPWRSVLFAFCVGLVQDLVGYGYIGFHAIALAGGIFVALFVATQIRQSGIFERLIVVGVALVTKWALFFALVAWLYDRNALIEIFRVAPLEIVFTVVLGLIILPLVDALMKRNGILRREFL